MNGDGVFVFLGPTLAVDAARAVLPATYLPPAAMGDVYALIASRPRVIAIIDGVFTRVPAVWHREILLALTQGIHVFGASSMGALRAAELHAFGMIGVGQVFEQFRDGALEDDDEVAVTHGDAASSFRQSSEAMVNLRHGLDRARDAGVIAPRTRDELVALAKQRYFPDRSWPAVFEDAHRAGIGAGEIDALSGFVRRERPSLKRDDALALLHHLAQFTATEVSPHAVTFELESSESAELMLVCGARLDRHIWAAPDERLTETDVARYVKLVRSDRRDIFKHALSLHLRGEERERLGHGRGDFDPLADLKPLPLPRSPAVTQDSNHEALEDPLLFRHGDFLVSSVSAALAERGELAEVMKQAARHRGYLARAQQRMRAPEPPSPAALFDWYKENFGPFNVPTKLLYESYDEFLLHVAALYEAEFDEAAAAPEAADRGE